MPVNAAESKLVDKLNEMAVDDVYHARHKTTLDFSLKPEPRYFLPDGSTNPASIKDKGTTVTRLFKAEGTNKDQLLMAAGAQENEWGLAAKLTQYSTSTDPNHPSKHSLERTVEVRSDADAYLKGTGEQVVETMVMNDIKDDRLARAERVQKFSELAPKMPNIAAALSTAPVLLPDDELVFTADCTAIEGIPAKYLGKAPRDFKLSYDLFKLKLTKGEKGLIVFSLIKNNKSGRMRFHITLTDGKLEFSAKESFSEFINAQSSSCCNLPMDGVLFASTMSLQYHETSDFHCRDLAIPVPQNGFKTAFVERKSHACATVSAGAAAQDAHKNGSDSLGRFGQLFHSAGLGSCFSTLPLCFGLATCEQALSVLDKPCFCQGCKGGVNLLVHPLECCCGVFALCCLCNPPCVAEREDIRRFYPCCSKACTDDFRTCICCIQKAGMVSVKTIDYKTSEHYEIGDKDALTVKKFRYDQPGPARHEEDKKTEWKMCPWW